jgi:uncharacterized membrane protein
VDTQARGPDGRPSEPAGTFDPGVSGRAGPTLAWSTNRERGADMGFHGFWVWAALALVVVTVILWGFVVGLLAATHEVVAQDHDRWSPAPPTTGTGSQEVLTDWPSVEEILAERLALGEIDEEQYQHLLEAVRRGRPAEAHRLDH